MAKNSAFRKPLDENTAFRTILDEQREYYGKRFAEFGETARGVDWNGEASQELRFRVLGALWRDLPAGQEFSVNEIGCGYGALYAFLQKTGARFTYHGTDLSEPMIFAARRRFARESNCRFSSSNDDLGPADYTVCSGIFNIHNGRDPKLWESYVHDMLHRMDRVSTKGFAFNMLTSYSDAEYMEDHLYYPDPCAYFDYCKRNFAKNVAIRHDYGLYDFTILVRKESADR